MNDNEIVVPKEDVYIYPKTKTIKKVVKYFLVGTINLISWGLVKGIDYIL